MLTYCKQKGRIATRFSSAIRDVTWRNSQSAPGIWRKDFWQPNFNSDALKEPIRAQKMWILRIVTSVNCDPWHL